MKNLKKTKRTSFNALNPCDYVRFGQTMPSRGLKAWYSDYAVEAAAANLQRTQQAMQNKIEICRLQEEEQQWLHQGKIAETKLRQTKKGRRALLKQQIQQNLVPELAQI